MFTYCDEQIDVDCYVIFVSSSCIIVVIVILTSIWPVETSGDMTNQNLSSILEVFLNYVLLLVDV